MAHTRRRWRAIPLLLSTIGTYVIYGQQHWRGKRRGIVLRFRSSGKIGRWVINGDSFQGTPAFPTGANNAVYTLIAKLELLREGKGDSLQVHTA